MTLAIRMRRWGVDFRLPLTASDAIDGRWLRSYVLGGESERARLTRVFSCLFASAERPYVGIDGNDPR